MQGCSGGFFCLRILRKLHIVRILRIFRGSVPSHALGPPFACLNLVQFAPVNVLGERPREAPDSFRNRSHASFREHHPRRCCRVTHAIFLVRCHSSGGMRSGCVETMTLTSQRVRFTSLGWSTRTGDRTVPEGRILPRVRPPLRHRHEPREQLVVVLPDQRHTAMNTAPELFLAAVVDFLSE